MGWLCAVLPVLVRTAYSETCAFALSLQRGIFAVFGMLSPTMKVFGAVLCAIWLLRRPVRVLL